MIPRWKPLGENLHIWLWRRWLCVVELISALQSKANKWRSIHGMQIYVLSQVNSDLFPMAAWSGGLKMILRQSISYAGNITQSISDVAWRHGHRKWGQGWWSLASLGLTTVKGMHIPFPWVSSDKIFVSCSALPWVAAMGKKTELSHRFSTRSFWACRLDQVSSPEHWSHIPKVCYLISYLRKLPRIALVTNCQESLIYEAVRIPTGQSFLTCHHGPPLSLLSKFILLFYWETHSSWSWGWTRQHFDKSSCCMNT